MGKREEKKIQTRRKIVDIAKISFIERGFEETKTSLIAKEVGIAEGTVFNYFDTKVDLLVAVIGEYFDIEDYEFKSTDKSDQFSEFTKAIQYYLSNVDLVNKDLLRIVFSTVFMEKNDNHKIFNIMNIIDKKIINNVRSHIEKIHLQKSESEIEAMMRIIYSSIIFSFGEYILIEEMTKEQLTNNILNCVKYVLESL